MELTGSELPGPSELCGGTASESRGVPSYRRHVEAATVNQGYFQRGQNQSRAVSLSFKDYLLICC